jgi:hypothetical protein
MTEMRQSDPTVQRLADENEALREKLARHEFRQLERELTGPDPFRLDVRVGDVPVPNAVSWPAVENPLLPRLPVPLGTIQREDVLRTLPVIAVHDGGLTGKRLAAALLGLMKTQYRDPFARLVFLCTGLEAVPFLGRYGFLAEHVGPTDPADTLVRLHRRYGVQQIRSLETGSVIAERTGG